MIFTDYRRGAAFAKDPSVVHFKGRALMYYSQGPKGEGQGMEGFAIGIAESHDLDHWAIVGELLPGAPVEAKGLCAPGAIVLGDSVHLFYQTYGNGARDALCHAVSSDGIHFTRHPGNPIIRPTGAWNAGRAIDADAVLFKGRLWVYWATRDPAMKIQQLGVHHTEPASGFAADAWMQGNPDAPILKPELPWEGACIEAPAMVAHDGRLFMWYGGAYNAAPQQIGCAVSDDGVHFSRLAQEPWLPCGAPGSWNQHESGHPGVYTAPDGQNHLFFQGTGDKGKTWWITRRKIEWKNGLPLPG